VYPKRSGAATLISRSTMCDSGRNDSSSSRSFVQRVDGPRQVGVAQHRPLGVAGGARGVDEHGRIVGPDGGEALLDRARVGGVPRAAGRQHVVPRQDAGNVLGLDDDHPTHGLAARRDGQPLLELLGVLEHQADRVGVVQMVVQLVRAAGGVHPDRGAAGGLDRDVGHQPLGSVLAQHRHACPGLQTQVEHLARQGVHVGGVGGPGDAPPQAQFLDAVRQAGLLRALAQQRGDAARRTP